MPGHGQAQPRDTQIDAKAQPTYETVKQQQSQAKKAGRSLTESEENKSQDNYELLHTAH